MSEEAIGDDGEEDQPARDGRLNEGDRRQGEGADMQAHYDLVSWSDGKELDSSWKRGAPFPLKDVGHAQVIDGWNEGLIGMKQGGRRLLVVPPDKGYGSSGGGPVKPGETLLFVVDAVRVGS